MNRIQEIAQIKPSKRQLLWHETEFYAFVHFGMNTFTNREWGIGNENPALFNPINLNADQWVDACVCAGMKGIILTCKHHDGFCLWPSAYTEHSVKKSLWKNGNGDVIREVSESCRKAGIKFGIYLSPWDRHEKTYGDSEKYNGFYMNQLKELLTGYGDIFSVWFDGACGEGPHGKRQIYEWEGYYKLIRDFQPDAVISVCGPDVRWCGNEAGQCRKSEWSVVPESLVNVEKIQNESQKSDDRSFSKRFTSQDEDLGSREVVLNADKLTWYPAEVNTSIRPGWFYHPEEDSKVKTLEELLSIYNNSVGGNSNFLLNIPPDTRGLFHENDVARLKELGYVLERTFMENIAKKAKLYASETKDSMHDVYNILDGSKDTYWRPKEGTENAFILIDLLDYRSFNKIVLMEYINAGQRTERFLLEHECNGKWSEFFTGTVIGYKRICCFDKIKARYIRLSITESRWFPTLSKLSIHLADV